jgi:hypothetical protein
MTCRVNVSLLRWGSSWWLVDFIGQQGVIESSVSADGASGGFQPIMGV